MTLIFLDTAGWRIETASETAAITSRIFAESYAQTFG